MKNYRISSAIALFVLWFAHVPALGPNAYQGPHGWHQTIRYKDREVHPEKEEISEALHVCADHDWKGYVQWNSMIGKEVDSCSFLKLLK